MSALKVGLMQGFTNGNAKAIVTEIVSLVRYAGICGEHNLSLSVLVVLYIIIYKILSFGYLDAHHLLRQRQEV